MVFKCYIQISGSGGSSKAGSFPTVFLFLDNNRYMFGCGEGTQRLLGESRIRFNCIGTILLTGLSWKDVGGLIGASLTMSEMGNKSVRVLGPTGLVDYIRDSYSFILKKDLVYNLHEYSGNVLAEHPELGRYTDGVMTFIPVPVECQAATEKVFSPAPNHCPLLTAENKPLSAMDQTVINAVETQLRVKGIDERKEKYAEMAGLPFPSPPGSPTASQPSEKYPRMSQPEKKLTSVSLLSNMYFDGDYSDLIFRRDSVAVSYICHVPDTPGKFQVAKAVELGIPAGPLRGRLAHGETVVTPEGRIVRSEECMSPAVPGPVFIVASCPDEAHVSGLVSAKAFEPYYCNNGLSEVEDMSGRVTCVVHFSPKHVVVLEEYRKWAARFRSEVQHIFIGNGFQACEKRVDFERFANTQARLNAVSPNNYPLLQTAELSNKVEIDMLREMFHNAAVPPLKTKYEFAEGYKMKIEEAPESNYIPEREAAAAAASIAESTGITIPKIDNAEAPQNLFAPLPEDEFRVTFMGTGASLPSRHRNVSGILIQMGGPEAPCVIFDCGEGTYGQMRRFFGGDVADDIIQNHLVAIAISHSHADHHLGIAQIFQIKAMSRSASPIHLIASVTVLNWVRHYAAAARMPQILAPEVLKMTPIKDAREQTEEVKGLFAKYGANLRAVIVDHCYDAHGLILTGKDWKISFSGDSRPLDSFAAAAENSTVLIHEATLSDDMKTEAIVKGHSTIGEALHIGKLSHSKYTVLTHFSQRFPKLSESMLVDASNFIYGSDMLTFTKSQLPQLMKLAPTIAAMLCSSEEEKEEPSNNTDKKETTKKDKQKKKKKEN